MDGWMDGCYFVDVGRTEQDIILVLLLLTHAHILISNVQSNDYDGDHYEILVIMMRSGRKWARWKIGQMELMRTGIVFLLLPGQEKGGGAVVGGRKENYISEKYGIP